MKLISESPNKLVLKNHNYANFTIGIILFLVGSAILFFMSNQGLPLQLIGGFLALVGLYVSLTTKSITMVLDKSANNCAISSWGLLKRESRSIELGQITGLALQIRTEMGSSQSATRATSNYVYTLNFQLKGAEEIPLDFGKKPISLISLSSPHDEARKKARQIADFLGLPLTELAPPSFADAISAIKDGIAEGMAKYGKNIK